MLRKTWLFALLIVSACSSANNEDAAPQADSLAVDSAASADTLSEAQQIEESMVGREDTPVRMASLAVTTTPAEQGEAAFRNICSNCHVSPKAFDLAHFQYPDSVITRRSLFHNDLQTAQNIVAHVNSLAQNDSMTPKSRPFQPGGVLLASDQEFGVRLFGSDMWPPNMTRDQLLQYDPLKIPVALPFAPWSDEASEFEWLAGIPHDPLPAGIRAAIAPAVTDYLNNPSMTLASIVVRRARTMSHNSRIPDAPCLLGTSRYNPLRCTEVGEWGGVLLYVEALRQNNLHGLARQMSDQFWEIGHDFHKVKQMRRNLPQLHERIAWWMHMSWIYNPAMNKAATYETGSLAVLGHRRLATFVAARSQVARRAGALHACGDVHAMAMDGSPLWARFAVEDGYRELQFRKRNGMLTLSASNMNTCVDLINKTQQRLSTINRAALQPLADSTITIITR